MQTLGEITRLDPLDRPLPPIPSAESEWAELLRRRCAGLRFGSIEITVENSKVVRIELTSRSRVIFDAPPVRFRSGNRTQKTRPQPGRRNPSTGTH